MKKSKFTEEQIVHILKEVEAGAKVVETCRVASKGSANRRITSGRTNTRVCLCRNCDIRRTSRVNGIASSGCTPIWHSSITH